MGQNCMFLFILVVLALFLPACFDVPFQRVHAPNLAYLTCLVDWANYRTCANWEDGSTIIRWTLYYLYIGYFLRKVLLGKFWDKAGELAADGIVGLVQGQIVRRILLFWNPFLGAAYSFVTTLDLCVRAFRTFDPMSLKLLATASGEWSSSCFLRSFTYLLSCLISSFMALFNTRNMFADALQEACVEYLARCGAVWLVLILMGATNYVMGRTPTDSDPFLTAVVSYRIYLGTTGMFNFFLPTFVIFLKFPQTATLFFSHVWKNFAHFFWKLLWPIIFICAEEFLFYHFFGRFALSPISVFWVHLCLGYAVALYTLYGKL